MLEKRGFIVQIPVSNKCNMECPYCNVEESQFIERKQIEKWINEYSDAFMIVFLGKEPLLRDDLADFVKLVKNMSYVSTNGRLLNEKLEELINAGLDILEISADTYDPVKGYEKILDKELVKRLSGRIWFKLHQVLDIPVLDETPKLLRFAEENKIPISFGLLNRMNYSETGRIKKTLEFLIEKNSSVVVNPLQYFIDGIKILDGDRVDWGCVLGEGYINLSKQDNYCSVLGSRYPDDKSCQSSCMSACAYFISYYLKNPLLSSLING
jgi:MoaA/NifB/PqqE/SkfB family radical SAM enzyme